jgi:cytoskeletal protein CcmA (bactofilin family)
MSATPSSSQQILRRWGYKSWMKEPKRRFLERAIQASATATFIAADSVFVGNIRARGQFVVFGEVQGDGDLSGGLHLSASGRWHGDVRCEDAIVAGTLVGALTVAGKVEIGNTAIIRGSVTAQTIAIAKGAIVEGEIKITSGKPLVRFEERRIEP